MQFIASMICKHFLLILETSNKIKLKVQAAAID